MLWVSTLLGGGQLRENVHQLIMATLTSIRLRRRRGLRLIREPVPFTTRRGVLYGHS